ncbi:hypothetical protein [Nonomuraea sp. NPDC003201]
MRRVLAWIAAVLAVLALVGLGGAGWYYSGLVIDPSHGGSYPLEVVAFEDGTFHLGATEWREVAAAISYARGQGATGVVLYGFSMGGASPLWRPGCYPASRSRA